MDENLSEFEFTEEDGIAKAEFQLNTIIPINQTAEALALEKFTAVMNYPPEKAKKRFELLKSRGNFDCLIKEYEEILKKSLQQYTIYESVIPQEYTFNDAKKLLGNEQEFDKLNYGEKLNCIRAIAVECSGEMGIRCPQIYFSDLSKGTGKEVSKNLAKLKTDIMQDAVVGESIVSTDIILMELNLNARNILMTVPHEIKHYQQELAKQGFFSKNQKISKAKLRLFYESSLYDPSIRLKEIDAEEYAIKFNKRHFPFAGSLKYEEMLLKSRKEQFTEQNIKKSKPMNLPDR